MSGFSNHSVSEAEARKFLVGRDSHPEDRRIDVGSSTVGGDTPTIIAGPCAVEDRDSFLGTVEGLTRLGVRLIRANVHKFRTLPSSFQGLGDAGIPLLEEARKRFDVSLVSEVINPDQVAALAPVVDVFQVGSRSMMNTSLLKALARAGKPVLLKRLFSATLGEFLAAAEYLAQGGNARILLCERGIRWCEPWTRFTLDVQGIALLRHISPQPVIADISHSLGRTDVALPVARAALAAGAGGLMIEVHQNPGQARSDACQQMTLEQLDRMLKDLGHER